MLKTLRNLLVVICIGLMVTSCASSPQLKNNHTTQIKNDFASGIGASVDYVTDGDRTFILLNVDNPKMKQVEVWFHQTYLSVGAETVRKRRLIRTRKSVIQQTIRASRLEDGIREVIVFVILDVQGKVLLKTEPIQSDIGPKSKSHPVVEDEERITEN